MNADQRKRYPSHWDAISRFIRFNRAQSQCECRGECGRPHGNSPRTRARCKARHFEAHPVTGSRVELQTAHLDHDETNCTDSNLKAMCQRCHVNYDAAEKVHRRRAARHQDRAPVRELFDHV